MELQGDQDNRDPRRKSRSALFRRGNVLAWNVDWLEGVSCAAYQTIILDHNRPGHQKALLIQAFADVFSPWFPSSVY